MFRRRRNLIIVVMSLVIIFTIGCGSKEDKPDNSGQDFAKGVDISALYALEASGAEYYYADGNPGDILDILRDSGINYVRIRIWNDPYEQDGSHKGYGAGNCDLSNAVKLGKRATEAGLKVYIDFHYSDFWADPAKQFAPKEWSSYSLAEKETALYKFTYDALSELLDEGVDIGMVQIGNETNGSMCGIGGLYDGIWDLSSGVSALMKQGCRAIDDINSKYGRSMLKVLHFTDLLADGKWYAQCLDTQKVNYDVYATSFYPMWHGAAEDMKVTLIDIANTYDKKVMVAETAYPYTYVNNDSEGNNIANADAMNFDDYEVSAKGQAQALRDVLQTVADINKDKDGFGLGAFYWEPEWIAVDSSTWGSEGSGWVSSASGNYELMYDTSVQFYSLVDKGSSWDNMTLFDKDGVALGALNVFKEVNK